MSDLINRDDARRAIQEHYNEGGFGHNYSDGQRCMDKINALPSISTQSCVRCEGGCDLCRDDRLEKGDTLYQSSDWDGGIGFDYISDIRFCPKCGRELTQWEPKPPKEGV